MSGWLPALALPMGLDWFMALDAAANALVSGEGLSHIDLLPSACTLNFTNGTLGHTDTSQIAAYCNP